LATLTTPFSPDVWVALFVSTVLIILLLRPKDPIGLLGIIVGQGYQKLKKTTAVRNILLVLWSLMVSTSISFLYDGLLTADMLVPLPDKVSSSI
jgi:hypothetical protein